jgi:hypothetical protein
MYWLRKVLPGNRFKKIYFQKASRAIKTYCVLQITNLEMHMTESGKGRQFVGSILGSKSNRTLMTLITSEGILGEHGDKNLKSGVLLNLSFTGLFFDGS